MMQRKKAVQLHPIRRESKLHSPQEKLSYKILQREEINAKKYRLEQVLVQQYTSKYAFKPFVSKINVFIKTAVKDLLSQSDDALITEDMLETLESEIREFSNNIKRDIQLNKIADSSKQRIQEQKISKATTETSFVDASTSVSSVFDMDISNKDRPAIITPEHSQQQKIDQNRWSVVSAILALDDEEQKLKERNLLLSRNTKYKDGLDKQAISIKAKEMKAIEEKLKLVEYTRITSNRFEEENRITKLLLEDRIRKEKALRMDSMQERKELKERERQAKVILEQFELAQNCKLTLDEEERRLAKKRLQKKAFDDLKVEDDKNKKMKEERITNQKQFESAQAREFEAKMQREEEKRANEYQARLDAKSAMRSSENPVDAKELEKRRIEKLREDKLSEARRINEEFIKKAESDNEKERLKAEIRRKDMAKSSEFNFSLVDRREQRKLQDREEAAKDRMNMEKEAAKARAKDEALAERKKTLMFEVKATLDEQVRKFYNKRINSGALSEKEVALNKGILDKIQADPDLRDKLYAKLNDSSIDDTAFA